MSKIDENEQKSTHVIKSSLFNVFWTTFRTDFGHFSDLFWTLLTIAVKVGYYICKVWDRSSNSGPAQDPHIPSSKGWIHKIDLQKYVQNQLIFVILDTFCMFCPF